MVGFSLEQGQTPPPQGSQPAGILQNPGGGVELGKQGGFLTRLAVSKAAPAVWPPALRGKPAAV